MTLLACNMFSKIPRQEEEGTCKAAWNRTVVSFVDASGNVDLVSFRKHWHSGEARAERGKLHQKKSLHELNRAKEE